jgi:hypothetical protein
MRRHLAWTFALMAGGCDDSDKPEDPGWDTGDCLHWAWPDADGDGYGQVDGEPAEACPETPPGHVLEHTDCDDSDPDIHPGAEEHCDGVDEDCNHRVDDGAVDPVAWYHDQDGDGYGDERSGGTSCEVPSDGSAVGGDCDDDDPTIHPDAEELCDEIDQDCDGNVNEGCFSCDLWVPGDHETIKEAIHEAPEGANICVLEGTWEEQVDFAGRDLQLIGVHGPERTVLDARNLGPVLHFHGDESEASWVTGFTLRNGFNGSGGCVEIIDASPRLSDLVVTGCEAEEGGGIHLLRSHSQLEDIQVSDCTALSGDGGGIHILGGAPSLTRVRVSDSVTPSFGGCIAAKMSAPVMADLELVHCYALDMISGANQVCGGGLYLEECEGSLIGALIEGNGATDGNGGGLYMTASSTELRDLEVLANGVANGEGGGIEMVDSSPQISDLIVRGNSARNDGGWYLRSSHPHCERVTIRDNEATKGEAGGWSLYASNPVCSDVIITDNRAGSGGGGGMNLEGSAPVVERITISDNQAWLGGGIQMRYGSAPVLSQLILTGNVADSGQGGAARLLDEGVLTIDHALVAGNSASMGGAFHLRDEAALSISNAVVAGNHAEHFGGAFYLYGHAQLELGFVSVHAHTGEHSLYSSGGTTLIIDHSSISGTGEGAGLDMDDGGGFEIRWSNGWDNAEGDWEHLGRGVLEQELAVDPAYLDTSATDPSAWDLHLGADSELVDAGDPSVADPDGSRADIGAFGGPGAGAWDLDGDGYPAWWQPGPYDPATHPAAGWDCDDRDASVHPGAGC